MAGNPESAKAEIVVFVHGLWMTGMELFYLRRLVRDAGYRVEQFSYRTISGSLDHNAEILRDFLESLDAPAVHLVGHSLGGLLILRMFETLEYDLAGRVVFIGSPVQGSQTAKALAATRFGSVALGKSGGEGLTDSIRHEWRFRNELGVIAGTAGVGIGRAISELPEPNDGTVAVEETRISGATDSIDLPVTHSGMAISRQVADQIVHFVRQGRFEREAGVAEP
jgi:pimeloyl-ACP methyl ester carboxylesterase